MINYICILTIKNYTDMEKRFDLTSFDLENAPKSMRKYLMAYGSHFNKKSCEYAIKQMRKKNETTHKIEQLESWNKDEVDELLKKYNIELEHSVLYDYVYIANMAKSDFYKSSLATEKEVAQYIKDVIDDVDKCEGFVFNRWLADCDFCGTYIEWEDLL